MKVLKQIATVAVIVSLVSCNTQKPDVKSLDSAIDSVSYALGQNMAKQLQNGFSEVNGDVFVQGYRNATDSVKTLIDEKDIQKTINEYFQKKQVEARKKLQAEGEETKAAGEAFLAENKQKEGVKTTESGLQYEIIKKGTGRKPKANSTVKIHYHGTTIEGVVFDSTVEKNQPYTAKPNQFVKGFAEGLQLMRQGAKYRFFIPQELAYGSQARSAEIKPYSALIFELELLEVK